MKDYTYAAVQRIFGSEISCNSLKVGTRLLNADPRFQPADRAPTARATFAFLPYCLTSRNIRHEWAPQLDLALCRVAEQFGNFARHYADNRVRLIIDPNGIAKYGRIAMKPRAPEVIAENRLELISPSILFILKQTPQQRLDAQHREVFRWDQPYPHLLRLDRSAAGADILRPNVIDGNLLESVVLVGKIPNVHWRRAG